MSARISGFNNAQFKLCNYKNNNTLIIDAFRVPSETDLQLFRDYVWSNGESYVTGEFVDAVYLRLCMASLKDLATGEVSDETQGYINALKESGVFIVLTGAAFVL